WIRRPPRCACGASWTKPGRGSTGTFSGRTAGRRGDERRTADLSEPSLVRVHRRIRGGGPDPAGEAHAGELPAGVGSALQGALSAGRGILCPPEVHAQFRGVLRLSVRPRRRLCVSAGRTDADGTTGNGTRTR